MKVKELIELLSKENPESEIYLDVDVDLLMQEFDWSLAKSIKVLGHEARYEDYEGTIRKRKQLEEYIIDINNLDEEPTQEMINNEIDNHTLLSGLWIRIEP